MPSNVPQANIVIKCAGPSVISFSPALATASIQVKAEEEIEKPCGVDKNAALEEIDKKLLEINSRLNNKRRKSRSSSRSRSGSSSSDEDSFYDKETARRRLKERRRNYKRRVADWEQREGEMKDYYQRMERRAERRGNSTREMNNLRTFHANYKDEENDRRWFKGDELKHRRHDYEEERRKDARDRKKEREELEKLEEMSRKKQEDTVKEEVVTPSSEADPSCEQWTAAAETVTQPVMELLQPITNISLQPTMQPAPQSLSAKIASVFGQKEDEDVDHLRTKKTLKPFEITVEERAALMTEEEKKKIMKDILNKIPRERDELFAVQIDRSQIDGVWMTKRVRPWVMKRILEYIGEEESSFCDFMCEKITNELDPHKIMKDIAIILDEDAEMFMIKLWRMLIFETEAKRLGLPTASTPH